MVSCASFYYLLFLVRFLIICQARRQLNWNGGGGHG